MSQSQDAVIRVINGVTIQPFVAGPLAEPKRVRIHRDLKHGRIYAWPKPVWVAAETSSIWGFTIDGVPVSLPAMRTILPGQSVEFCEIRIGMMERETLYV